MEEWDKGRSPPPISPDFHFYNPTPSRPFFTPQSKPSKQALPYSIHPCQPPPGPTVPAIHHITSHHNLLFLPVPSLIITPPPTIPPFLSAINPKSIPSHPFHPRLLSETLKKKKKLSKKSQMPIHHPPHIIFLLS